MTIAIPKDIPKSARQLKAPATKGVVRRIDFRAATKGQWTPESVFERIEEAVVTVSQIPSPRLKPRGFRYGMPQPIRRYFEGRTDYGDPGYDDGTIKIEPDKERSDSDLGPAHPMAIDRAYEVEDWLQFLSRRKRELLWRLAAHDPMHKLEGRFRRTRRQLLRWKNGALGEIVKRLNGD